MARQIVSYDDLEMAPPPSVIDDPINPLLRVRPNDNHDEYGVALDSSESLLLPERRSTKRIKLLPAQESDTAAASIEMDVKRGGSGGGSGHSRTCATAISAGDMDGMANGDERTTAMTEAVTSAGPAVDVQALKPPVKKNRRRGAAAADLGAEPGSGSTVTSVDAVECPDSSEAVNSSRNRKPGSMRGPGKGKNANGKGKGRSRRRGKGGVSVRGMNTNDMGSVQLQQHWDDPGEQNGEIVYDESGEVEVGEGEAEMDIGNGSYAEEENNGGKEEEEGEEGDEGEAEEEDECRELTREEIWDDSALIDAWDAANEEYEVMHGRNKRWKKERTHKSALWYVVPPEKPKSQPKAKAPAKAKQKQWPNRTSPFVAEEDSSAPLNFDTYVPSHDASLSSHATAGPCDTAYTSTQVPPIPDRTVKSLGNIREHFNEQLLGNSQASEYVNGTSADEAFSRAIAAMYWTGYWTAVYEMQRGREREAAADSDFKENYREEEGEDEEEALISTQR